MKLHRTWLVKKKNVLFYDYYTAYAYIYHLYYIGNLEQQLTKMQLCITSLSMYNEQHTNARIKQNYRQVNQSYYNCLTLCE